MALTNPRNFGVAIGRLASDVRFFNNQDGSRTVRLTVMSDHNYTSRDGNRGSDAVSLERFIPADKTNGVFDLVNQGDLVEVMYHVVTDAWTDSQGQKRYALKLIVDEVSLLEPRSVTSARLKKRVQTQTAVNNAQTAQRPVQVAQQPADHGTYQPELPLGITENNSPFGIDQDNPPF